MHELSRAVVGVLERFIIGVTLVMDMAAEVDYTLPTPSGLVMRHGPAAMLCGTATLQRRDR